MTFRWALSLIAVFFTALSTLLFSLSSFALVDMRNANFSDTWTDLIVPGSGYDLRVRRAYNSRTLFNGIFGFGWCSDFESTIEITADSSIKLVECGGGMKLTYTPKNYDSSIVAKTNNQIIAEVKKRNKTLKPAYLKDLRNRLTYDDVLRDEFTRQLKIKGQIKKGVAFFAHGRENESITLHKGVYTRTMSDGTYQKYSAKGKMTHMYDRNGNYLKLIYANKKLVGVVDNNGRKLTLTYHPSVPKVKKITGPNGLSVAYGYKGEDLTSVKNAWKNTFTYKYDGVHNLTKIGFPDKTTKELSYNEDRDWVTGFKDRRGCKETYVYKTNKKDPINHYWSTVVKKCGKKVTNNSRYEFIHKIRNNGSRYLYRSISNNNGDKTDIIYHQVFGKPVSIRKNATLTSFSYFKNGMIKLKKEPLRVTKFQYKNTCKKVSTVRSQYYTYKQGSVKRTTASKRKKVKAKAVKTNFFYDKKRCNLISAKNSDGQKVKIGYDLRGRIAKITDQAKKTVSIKYEEKFGKPEYVTRPGLGTLRVRYKANGTIDKVDSKEGPQVAVQVAGIFNNLLDIIAPATSDVSL